MPFSLLCGRKPFDCDLERLAISAVLDELARRPCRDSCPGVSFVRSLPFACRALTDQVRDERFNLVIGRAPDQGYVDVGDLVLRPGADTTPDLDGWREQPRSDALVDRATVEAGILSTFGRRIR